jgi:hypothetical protein
MIKPVRYKILWTISVSCIIVESMLLEINFAAFLYRQRGSWDNFCFINMTVFWVVAPCSLVEIDRRFRDAYCLYSWAISKRPNYGRSTHLWNVGQFLPDYMEHTRRLEQLKSHGCSILVSNYYVLHAHSKEANRITPTGLVHIHVMLHAICSFPGQIFAVTELLTAYIIGAARIRPSCLSLAGHVNDLNAT